MTEFNPSNDEINSFLAANGSSLVTRDDWDMFTQEDMFVLGSLDIDKGVFVLIFDGQVSHVFTDGFIRTKESDQYLESFRHVQGQEDYSGDYRKIVTSMINFRISHKDGVTVHESMVDKIRSCIDIDGNSHFSYCIGKGFKHVDYTLRIKVREHDDIWNRNEIELVHPMIHNDDILRYREVYIDRFKRDV